MNPDREIDRVLTTWLQDGPTGAPDRVLDTLTERIAHQSQRPGWRLDWRHLRMNTTFKLATTVAAVAIVVVVGYNLLSRASSGIGSGASIEGTWAATFTKSELVASPLLVDDGEINDGNWGDWKLTFKDGQVSYTQSNSVESSASSGTFTTNGDTIVMVFDTGANAGETFGFRWSTSNDVLTFQRDQTIGIGPTPFLVKSWTRSS